MFSREKKRNIKQTVDDSDEEPDPHLTYVSTLLNSLLSNLSFSLTVQRLPTPMNYILISRKYRTNRAAY